MSSAGGEERRRPAAGHDHGQASADSARDGDVAGLDRVGHLSGHEHEHGLDELSTGGKAVHTLQDFVAGSISGMAGVAVGHPFDTVKVRVQTQPGARLLETVRTTLRRDGVRGFYRGLSAPLLTDSFTNSVLFAGYGATERFLHHNGALGTYGASASGRDEPSLAQVYVSGSVSGSLVCALITPVDLVKSRLQVTDAAGKRLHQGPGDCVRHIVRHDGLRGMFRGLTATMIRDVPSFGTYFLAYEWSKRSLSRSEQLDLPTPLVPVFAGAFAGSVAWTSSYPFDVVKTRWQTDTTGRYKSWSHCFVTSVRQEGVPVLFRGLLPTVIRSIPTNMAIFGVFELLIALVR